jgi:hypothetical protein
MAVITPPSTAAWASGTFSSASEALLVQLTNQARANAGRRALTLDSTLRTVARSRSKDMIERNYFSHSIPPDGHKVFDELKARGYCMVSAGENIGWNTYPDETATQAIQDMFMNSSGHRANILGSSWKVIGIGAYQGSTSKKMWTVLFANPCSGSTSTAAPKSTPKATPKPTAKPTPKPPAGPATPRPATPAPPAPVLAPESTPAPAVPPALDPGPDVEAVREAYAPAWLWAPPAVPARDEAAARQGGSGEAALDRGLRVADPPVAQGLFEAILGDVASMFLGS